MSPVICKVYIKYVSYVMQVINRPFRKHDICGKKNQELQISFHTFTSIDVHGLLSKTEILGNHAHVFRHSLTIAGYSFQKVQDNEVSRLRLLQVSSVGHA